MHVIERSKVDGIVDKISVGISVRTFARGVEEILGWEGNSADEARGE